MKNVVVIGGGAAGMMAAIAASQNNKKVILIEKNRRLGKKLYITGKGRCNVTTNKDVSEIIENVCTNPYFMYSSLYTFTNKDLMEMIEKGGVKLKVERGDRVFPESDKSSDIIKCLERYMQQGNVDVRLGISAEEIIADGDVVKGVRIDDGTVIKADSVIVATGGKSYPLTGSTGDGYKLLKKLGHTITDILPSLIPLTTEEEWVKDLMGLSLKNVEVTIKAGSKKVYKAFGEMLFTHFGVSGPVILSASRVVTDYLPGKVDIYIDLKPALDQSELDKRILRDFEGLKNKQFKNSLDALLPKKLIPIVIDMSGIDPEKQINSISKQERKQLIDVIKGFKVTCIGTRPIDEAIITHGGVDVKEVDPSTMESKIIKGLYITGELLDVDAFTGGFNLQIAFSTGYCAGINC